MQAEQKTLWRLRWRTIPGERARTDRDLLSACADLYSTSYGVWGPCGSRPGEHITRTPSDISKLLASSDSFLAVAELPDGSIVGYCVAVFAELHERGRIAWVSQLVVGEAYRNEGIATNLLFSIWQFSDRYAWGLVTANPYAVRALESATRRPCRLSEIRKHGNEVLAQLGDDVPYLPPQLESDGTHLRAVVDTHFYVSHDNVDEMRARAARGERPWALGNIAEGEEWFACTFASQSPVPLPPQRLEAILIGADRVWMDAFARMTLDGEHRWRASTTEEIEFVLSRIDLPRQASVLDVGCGDGRHAVALADHGLHVEGLDVVPALIDRARTQAGDRGGISFTVADAREPLPGKMVDLALLLYDVLGASANPNDDLVLLKNVTARLKPGASLVLSVMNAGPTAGRIPVDQMPKTDVEFVEALERLAPSNTMERSGDIFDPSLLLYYRGIYYRKEQFLQLENYLPSEHVVRDLRYSSNSLAMLIEAADLEIDDLRPVQSGHWNRDPMLVESDPDAKELLVIAHKPV